MGQGFGLAGTERVLFSNRIGMVHPTPNGSAKKSFQTSHIPVFLPRQGPGLEPVQTVLDRCIPDLFARVHQQGEVMIKKRLPFQRVRQITEDLFNTSNKFIGRLFCFLCRIKLSFAAPSD